MVKVSSTNKCVEEKYNHLPSHNHIKCSRLLFWYVVFPLCVCVCVCVIHVCIVWSPWAKHTSAFFFITLALHYTVTCLFIVRFPLKTSTSSVSFVAVSSVAGWHREVCPAVEMAASQLSSSSFYSSRSILLFSFNVILFHFSRA